MNQEHSNDVIRREDLIDYILEISRDYYEYKYSRKWLESMPTFTLLHTLVKEAVIATFDCNEREE